MSLNLAASGGTSWGLDLLGLRLWSIGSPHNEPAALSRLLTLPKVIAKITEQPLWGQGLGETISVYSPVAQAQIVTSTFDWGYLQLYVELGLLGGVAWFLLLVFIFKKLKQLGYAARGQSAAVIALLLSTITASALTQHALGFVLIVGVLSWTNTKNPQIG